MAAGWTQGMAGGADREGGGEAATRLKRIRLRSWRRGLREVDLILGGFADSCLDALAPADLAAFESLLSENDQDIYSWIGGTGSVPMPYSEIVARIRAFHSLEPRGR